MDISFLFLNKLLNIQDKRTLMDYSIDDTRNKQFYATITLPYLFNKLLELNCFTKLTYVNSDYNKTNYHK
jgi:hypothetical protein